MYRFKSAICDGRDNSESFTCASVVGIYVVNWLKRNLDYIKNCIQY